MKPIVIKTSPDATAAVVALVHSDDYAHSLSLLLDMAEVQGYFTTDINQALDLIGQVVPSVVLLDTRLRSRLTHVFDHIQKAAINRNMRLIFLSSAAVLPAGDRLELPLIVVDRRNSKDILAAVQQSLKRLPIATQV